MAARRDYFTLNLPMKYRPHIVSIARMQRKNIYQVVCESIDAIHGVPADLPPGPPAVAVTATVELDRPAETDGITVEDFGAVEVASE